MKSLFYALIATLSNMLFTVSLVLIVLKYLGIAPVNAFQYKFIFGGFVFTGILSSFAATASVRADKIDTLRRKAKAGMSVNFSDCIEAYGKWDSKMADKLIKGTLFK
jgi:hypothetical protein